MKFKHEDIEYYSVFYKSVLMLRFGKFDHGQFTRHIQLHKFENTIINDVLYNENYIAEGEYLFYLK